jgi:hypothetical protein
MSSSTIVDQKQQHSVVECPICYDEIDQLKNCVTTECGHQFHCNCLMKNSATNGFSCPMCRSVMAEEPESDDDEDEELSEFEDFEEEEQFDDNVLTSFRMFHQQLAGEEIEDEPEPEEQDEDQPLVEEQIVRPSAEILAARLVAQGYTMEDMVKCLLIDHEEYETEAEINERFADRMFGKFRQIISNYPREQREAQEQQQRQSLPGLVQRHQSIRLRLGPREEVEDCFARGSTETAFAQLQNRYQLLQDDDNEEV